MANRIDWIDTLKGLGIVFIMFGHQSAENAYVYSFHIPLFFFASGYLFDRDRYRGYSHFVKKKSYSILIPYVLFYCYSYVWQIVDFSTTVNISILSTIATDHYRPLALNKLIGLLRADGISAAKMGNASLWFLPCFFVTENMFYLMHTAFGKDLRKLAFWLVVLAIIAYGESLSGVRNLPWSIDRALTGTVFFGSGFVIKVLINQNRIPFLSDRRALAAAFPLLLFLSVVFSGMNGRVDMNGNSYGNILYFYLSAFSGIFFFAFVSKYLLSNTIFPYLGRNTIILLGLHQSISWYAVQAVDVFAGLISRDTIMINDIVLASLYTTVTIVAIIPFMFIVNTAMPFLVGKRSGTSFS